MKDEEVPPQVKKEVVVPTRFGMVFKIECVRGESGGEPKVMSAVELSTMFQ